LIDGVPFFARVDVPSSKSLTNRWLVLQALGKNFGGNDAAPFQLKNVLQSRDSALMANALEEVAKLNGDANDVQVDVGLAGTVMRFLPPYASLFSGSVHYDGDSGARKRPMGAMLNALEKLGVDVKRSNGDFLPFTCASAGNISGGEIAIDASLSSQFISGLMLSAPYFREGVKIIHRGEKLPSLAHIDMTIDCLRKCGIDAQYIARSGGAAEFVVRPGQVRFDEVVIEPDLSNAGPFLAAAMANPCGGEVVVPNWPKCTTQPGALFPEILQAMGAEVNFISTSETTFDLKITSDGTINAVDVDLISAGEIAPTVAALLALAPGQSTISGIAHLRGHETDRLAALVEQIANLGRKASISGDGDALTIHEMPECGLKSAVIESYHDHRMATFGAIVGLRVPGVRVVNIATTAKTMPEFPEMWQKMLQIEGVN
jgi:3-phosphoshikimate 1-carboxyvinyltransferase